MPAEVKILIEGYTSADQIEDGESKERTCPTISLVKDDQIIMIVDPGVMADKKILIDALLKEEIFSEQVNFVCITHSHIDHYRNLGIFPNAKVLEFYGVWENDTVSDWNENFSPNIQIIKTPGHNETSISLLVQTEIGVVGICGDVFWKENYPVPARKDIYASDPEKLQQSRDLVLRTVDWIIPGHGKMFKSIKPIASNQFSPKGDDLAKNIFICKKCRQRRKKEDSCFCKSGLCFHCCECDMDCNTCNCSHKR